MCAFLHNKSKYEIIRAKIDVCKLIKYLDLNKNLYLT